MRGNRIVFSEGLEEFPRRSSASASRNVPVDFARAPIFRALGEVPDRREDRRIQAAMRRTIWPTRLVETRIRAGEEAWTELRDPSGRRPRRAATAAAPDGPRFSYATSGRVRPTAQYRSGKKKGRRVNRHRRWRADVVVPVNPRSSVVSTHVATHHRNRSQSKTRAAQNGNNLREAGRVKTSVRR